METAGRFDNSTCQICRLSRFYIPLNRELDGVWVGCLPLTKLYFAIWVECGPPKWQEYCSSGGDTLAYNRTADGRRNAPCVQSHCRQPPECSLRTAVLPTAAGMLLAYNRTADGRRNGPHPHRHPTSAPTNHIRARHPTSAPTNHIRAYKPHPQPDDACPAAAKNPDSSPFRAHAQPITVPSS